VSNVIRQLVVTNFESHFLEHCTEILRARALIARRVDCVN
jgi:hypothetical protein